MGINHLPSSANRSSGYSLDREIGQEMSGVVSGIAGLMNPFDIVDAAKGRSDFTRRNSGYAGGIDWNNG